MPKLLGSIILVAGLVAALILITYPQLLTSQANLNSQVTIPHPVIVMDGLDLNEGPQHFGTNIFNETRAAMNIAIGDLEPQVQSGQITRAEANALVAQFRSEGKLHVERVQATKNGVADPATVVAYWSSVLDNYDGIFINEYGDDMALDGQSQNAIETFRQIRERYPNKVIMPAFTMSLGWSGKSGPYHGGEAHSYSQFLQAVRDYTDLVFYEFYVPSGRASQLVYFDQTKQAFNEAAPGILSKIFYGLYIPQTMESQGDSFGTDTTPALSISGHLAKQMQILRGWSDIAGVGFWVYYRGTPHMIKTVNSLVQNCYKVGNCSVPAANVLANPSFEPGFAPWSSTGAVQVVNYSANGLCNQTAVGNNNLNWCEYMNFGGSGALLVGSSGTAQVKQTVQLESGQTYYLKIFGRARNGDTRAQVRIQFDNGTKASATQTAFGSDRWQAREVWFKAATNSATIIIESACGGDFYIDSIKLEKTTYGEYQLLSGDAATCGTQTPTPTPSPTPAPLTPTPQPVVIGPVNGCPPVFQCQADYCVCSANCGSQYKSYSCRICGNYTSCAEESPTPTPVPYVTPPITINVDINNDGSVNIFDYSTLVEDFGRTNSPPSDIDRNGTVDIFDYGIFLEEWLKL